MGFVVGYFCIFMYLCGFTRVEKFGLAKGDGGEGEVAADEDHVGDAQGGQQVVEYVVHFPSISEIFRIYIIMYRLRHIYITIIAIYTILYLIHKAASR